MIPGGGELFASDTSLFGGVPFEQVEGKAPERGQVLGGVARAGSALILLEADVHHPVDFVFHTPVAAHRAGEQLHVQG